MSDDWYYVDFAYAIPDFRSGSLFNLAGDIVDGTITFARTPHAAWVTNLNEGPNKPLQIPSGAKMVPVSVQPHKILTLKVAFSLLPLLSSAETGKVLILHTNDLHDHVRPGYDKSRRFESAPARLICEAYSENL